MALRMNCFCAFHSLSVINIVESRRSRLCSPVSMNGSGGDGRHWFRRLGGHHLDLPPAVDDRCIDGRRRRSSRTGSSVVASLAAHASVGRLHAAPPPHTAVCLKHTPVRGVFAYTRGSGRQYFHAIFFTPIARLWDTVFIHKSYANAGSKKFTIDREALTSAINTR